MIPILENAALGTDLDCQGLDLRNVRGMYPVPPGLVDINDSRLYDPRLPPSASVTNESVAATAGITQHKLKLDSDVIPVHWLGNASTQAANGNLVEHAANKGVPGGYAPFDSTGKLFSSHVTATGSPGTVSRVGLSMQNPFNVTGSPVESGAGTLAVAWNNATNNSWFGVYGPLGYGDDYSPTFLVKQLPVELIPVLPATKFTTGTFDPDHLPVAIGMGSGHARGIVPDPGPAGDTGDYLGRDMQWRAFNSGNAYQPLAPEPSIVLASSGEGFGIVNITAKLPGSIMFYRVSDPTSFSVIIVDFQEAPSGSITITVPDHYFVEAYSAKQGYNNSEIASYTVVTPLTPPL